jgi:hypothetical protein
MELADHRHKVEVPKYDHAVSDDGTTMTYAAKTQSRSRTIIMTLLAMPFVAVGVIALLLVLPGVLIFGGGGSMIGPVLLTIVVCGLVALALYTVGSLPKVVPVRFTRDALLWRGKTYAREHVRLGWRSSGGYVSIGSGAQNTGAALGYALSGVIYLQYGGKEKALITGLHPDRVENVYNDLLRAMNKMGWNFKLD